MKNLKQTNNGLFTTELTLVPPKNPKDHKVAIAFGIEPDRDTLHGNVRFTYTQDFSIVNRDTHECLGFNTRSFSVKKKELGEGRLAAVLSRPQGMGNSSSCTVAVVLQGLRLLPEGAQSHVGASMTVRANYDVAIDAPEALCDSFFSAEDALYYDKDDFTDPTVTVSDYMFQTIKSTCESELNHAMSGLTAVNDICARVEQMKEALAETVNKVLYKAGLSVSSSTFSLSVGEPFGEEWDAYNAHRKNLADIERNTEMVHKQGELLDAYRENTEKVN